MSRRFAPSGEDVSNLSWLVLAEMLGRKVNESESESETECESESESECEPGPGPGPGPECECEPEPGPESESESGDVVPGLFTLPEPEIGGAPSKRCGSHREGL